MKNIKTQKQFDRLTNANKLRFLANFILINAERFNQHSTQYCAVGLSGKMSFGENGLHFNSWGSTNTEKFQEQFGLTRNETLALFTATYSTLNIGFDDLQYTEVTAGIAHDVIERLADKVEKRERINKLISVIQKSRVYDGSSHNDCVIGLGLRAVMKLSSEKLNNMWLDRTLELFSNYFKISFVNARFIYDNVAFASKEYAIGLLEGELDK